MGRSRGKRYDNEPKLNLGKVVAFLIAIAVIIMVFISIKNLLTNDKNKEIVVETTYFSVIENNKWGVIDNHGEYIIKPQYDEMIIIPNKNKDVFIIYEDVDYENETFTSKVLNSKSDEILNKYSNIEPIENYNGFETWYEQDLLKYKENDKYGLIDLKGNKVLEAEYTNIYALLGEENSIIVEKDGKKGLVNSKLNKLTVEANYLSINLLTDNHSDGYIVSNDEKFGIVNSNGKVILECKYSKVFNFAGNNMYLVSNGTDNLVINQKEEEIINLGNKIVTSINNNNFIFGIDNKYGIMNSSNEVLVNSDYDSLKYAFDKYYIASKDGKYGIITSEGETKLDFNYIDISYIKDANIIKLEKENNKTDIMNSNFEIKLLDIIISEINIDKGYIRVRQEENYKYYNFKLEEISNKDALATHTLFLTKENDKYGYINKDGEKIVDAIYDDAKEQNEYGYCAVKKDGLWGVIKSDGTLILKPSINLDENLIIDFISTWHLYNAENLNVYTK